MPNWCQNNLTISGDVSEIAKFNAWLGGEPLTLQKILPMPSELNDTTSPTPSGEEAKAKALVEKYGAADWYSWRVDNWGTKWDVEVDFDADSSSDDCMLFTFQSAWSPPTKAITALGELFPNLVISMKYREDGCLFAGCLSVSGDDVHEEYVDGGKDKDAYRAYVIANWGDDPFAWEDEEEEDLDHEVKNLLALAKVTSDDGEEKTKKKVKKKVNKTKAKKKPTKKVKSKKKKNLVR